MASKDMSKLPLASWVMECMFALPTPAAASSFAQKQGYEVRVVQIDGTIFVGTCDFRLDRINMTVENDKVTKLSRG